MRAAFGSDSVGYMQRQLKEWIDLSLNRNLPSSLLLLSRAFIFTRSTAARPARQPFAPSLQVSPLPSSRDAA